MTNTVRTSVFAPGRVAVRRMAEWLRAGEPLGPSHFALVALSGTRYGARQEF